MINWNYSAFITAIILYCSIGFIGADIYLPSLPNIVSHFQSTPAEVQLTVSCFFLGMALSQILFGILSDHFGRKKVMTIALLIFCVGSIGCIYAQSLEYLILSRLLQGIGASAGYTIGQAMVSDRFDFKGTAQALSLIVPLVAFSPAIAPVLGGYLETYFDYKAVFWFLLGYGLFLIALLFSPLLSTKEKVFSQLSLKDEEEKWLKTLIGVFKSKRFFSFAAMMIHSNAIYFAFVGITPFYVDSIGGSPVMTGYAYCLASFPYMGASILGRKILNTASAEYVIKLGLILNAIGIGLLCISSFLNMSSILSIILPMLVVCAGNGFLMPVCTSGALSLFPNSSGMVSGILGTAQLVAAGCVTALMGVFQNGTLYPLVILDVCSLIAALLVFNFYFRKFRAI